MAQYGQRVWNITEGTLEERANAAIDRTVAFLHELGVKTRLSEYTDDYAKSAEFIEKRFTERGWKALGERKDITPAIVKEIVELSY